jgi:hypothetical protein
MFARPSPCHEYAPVPSLVRRKLSMNAEVVRLEKHLRTLRDRVLYEVGPERRDECIAVYILDTALDTIETSTSVEIAYDLGLPSTLPAREWCKNCRGC